MSNEVDPDRCSNLRELMSAQMPHLKAKISLNKWFLSERENHDVGWEKAEEDYLKNYLEHWATGFKDCYCNHLCVYRETCRVKAV